MDVKISNKKEITFDLYTFTFQEYTKIFDGEGGDNRADELIAKSAGMTVDDLRSLPFPDNRKIVTAFFKKCRDVVSDPNSESASTSP